MKEMLLSEAARVLDGRVAAAGADADTLIYAVSTDTRGAVEGTLFFALPGENSDGHSYVARAFERGAAAAVVEREIPGTSGPQIVVSDSLAALGRLARYYPDRFVLPVVGITGSVGKTSTKEMVACALRATLEVLANEKNYNNEIGVPLTLFGLDPSHQAAVIEMGMRGSGQIADLCAIARPTIGLITNVGITHIELLGSRDAIARAKGELVESLPEEGVALLPADDDYREMLTALAGERRVVTFGVRNHADFRAENISFAPDGTSRFTIGGIDFAINAAGIHHVVNACAAVAAASVLGVDLPDVAAQLGRFRPPAMRMETLALHRGITLLNDAYNAAPDSMRAALETLALVASGRRTVAILGDMRELGNWTEAAHRFVGETAATNRIDVLVTVGESARRIAKSAKQGSSAIAVSFADTAGAARKAPSLIEPGDVVLVKGSRAMAMEKIVEAIVACHGRNSQPV